MPLYDFRCGSCGCRFEELQGADAPPPDCPACGTRETERLLSPFRRPRSAGGRDPSWTPAATRSDPAAGAHHHHP